MIQFTEEQWAEKMHDIWASWMKWMLSPSCCIKMPHYELPGVDCVHFKPGKLLRWMRQMHTAYKDLPEEEKQSDRDAAREHFGALMAAMKPPADNDPDFAKVYCHKCGKSKLVEAPSCWRTGWPLCCGETMSLNKPEGA